MATFLFSCTSSASSRTPFLLRSWRRNRFPMSSSSSRLSTSPHDGLVAPAASASSWVRLQADRPPALQEMPLARSWAARAGSTTSTSLSISASAENPLHVIPLSAAPMARAVGPGECRGGPGRAAPGAGSGASAAPGPLGSHSMSSSQHMAASAAFFVGFKMLRLRLDLRGNGLWATISERWLGTATLCCCWSHCSASNDSDTSRRGPSLRVGSGPPCCIMVQDVAAPTPRTTPAEAWGGAA
mmetsp:Transcript_109780/g.310595  ORF Transcript_109780/g.310595 Transcript_109780/m.310595 type:complete len:242 (-) Transcript_109780:3-728(-)